MNKSNMSISIVIPVYNGEKFISKLMEKIFSWSFINKYGEVIVINDGSTDNTEKQLIEYSRKKENFRYVSQPNLGGSSARNVGIQLSKGTYILFFDIDDMINVEYLQSIESILLEEKYDLIMSSYEIVDCNGNKIKDYILKDYQGKMEYNDLITLHPLPGNKIYKRDNIEKYSILFDDLKIGQDTNFYWKYVSITDNVFISAQIGFFYYIFDNSISRTYTNKIVDIINMYKGVLRFYNDNKCIYNQERLEYMYYRHSVKQIMKIAKVSPELRQEIINTFQIELQNYNWRKNKYLQIYRKLFLYLFINSGDSNFFLRCCELGMKLMQ